MVLFQLFVSLKKNYFLFFWCVYEFFILSFVVIRAVLCVCVNRCV